MGTYSGLLVVVVLTTVAGGAVVASQTMCPSKWIPISGPLVQNLGWWAVQQQQQHTVGVLHFHKVESARFQYIDDSRGNCELIIDASTSSRFGAGAGDSKKYRAVVEVLEMVVPQKVLSFEPVVTPPPTN